MISRLIFFRDRHRTHQPKDRRILVAAIVSLRSIAGVACPSATSPRGFMHRRPGVVLVLLLHLSSAAGYLPDKHHSASYVLSPFSPSLVVLGL